jgi:hypothetical protein
MYLDDLLVLSEAQAVVADANSTNYIDTEVVGGPGWKYGEPLAVIVLVKTVTVAGTGITFRVVHKATEPTTGDAALVDVTVLAVDLAVNKKIIIPLPLGVTILRMIRLYYDITAATESYVLSAYLGPLRSC